MIVMNKKLRNMAVATLAICAASVIVLPRTTEIPAMPNGYRTPIPPITAPTPAAQTVGSVERTITQPAT